MRKKTAGFFIVLWLALTLTACGKSSEVQQSVKEHVYRTEEVPIEVAGKDMNIRSMFLRDDRMYLVGYRWEETGSKVYIISQKPDGSDAQTVFIELDENSSLDYVWADGDGDYYAILNEGFEDDSDPENYVWINSYYLVLLDKEGKEVWRQPLNEGQPQEEFYNIFSMELLRDGRIFILDSKGFLLLDAQGKEIRRIESGEELSSPVVYQMEDGSLVINIYDEDAGRPVFSRLDPDTGVLSGEYTVPGQSNYYTYYAGVGRDFLLMGNDAVYGYNLGDTELTELMNIVDSDLMSSYIYNIVAIDKDSFYGLTNDDLTGEIQLLKYIKVDPEDVVDKKVLTLGCNGLDWGIRAQTVRFNKENPEYRIKIEDYSLYNTDEDYSQGMTRLNTDIVSGKVPDILVLQSGEMPVDSYVAKGLFEDLYPYFDKDGEISREDYFPNVLKAYETDGKLHRLIPSFVVQTVVGKTADVGAEPGWTLEELNAVLATKPEGTQIFTQMTRSTLLNYCLQMSGSQFVDWDTGECSFNSGLFLEFLEFMKQFPEEINESEYDEEYYRNYEAQWRNGSVLLSSLWLDGFQSYNNMRKGAYGEDITMIGFPTQEGLGSVIMPNLDMAMAASSSNKEGVWQFLRSFLLPEYQDAVTYGWPLRLKSVDALKEKAQKRESYEDENGNIIEYDSEYYIGDLKIPITPMTKEEVEYVFEYLCSVDQPYSYDQNLMNIIAEEAAPYFSGQKQAKEVADIIQSRAQIYVNENR